MIENFDQVIKKQKAKLKKHEFEEGLIHMRLRHNLLSKKEWEDRKKYISANMDQIPDKEKEFKDKLGLNEYFLNKNILLQSSMVINTKLDLESIKHKALLNGPLTERGKSQHKENRPKSQSVQLMQFKNEEEKKKHEEFIKKLKEEEKKRKKLRKQLEKIQLQKKKDKDQKVNQLKEKKEQEEEKEKKQRFLEMQENLAKKEKERSEQRQKQDEQL